ncbi:MAG: hypothetical protein QOG87_1334 [Actinomycetota bacterium]
MTDWATISSLATAGGTLVLAVATYASTRSANRAARVAERALLAGLRPVLVQSRLEGGQRTITRFGIMPRGEDGGVCSAVRHWNLGRDDPR